MSAVPVPASGPMPHAGTLASLMAFIDAGLYPFAHCRTCDELMPMSVDHGIGGPVALCCKCGTAHPPALLRFLDAAEAYELGGWRFQVTGEEPLN